MANVQLVTPGHPPRLQRLPESSLSHLKQSQSSPFYIKSYLYISVSLHEYEFGALCLSFIRLHSTKLLEETAHVLN